MDITLIENKLNDLLKQLREADETEVEEKEEETVEDTEETPDEDTVDEVEEIEVKETEEPTVSEEEDRLIKSIIRGTLQAQMDIVDNLKDIFANTTIEGEMKAVLDEINEDANKLVGKMQAVISVGDENKETVEIAREETEAKLEGEDETEVEETKEEKVEMIKPLEDEVEVDETEVEEKEKQEESLESDNKNSINEDLQVIVGYSSFEPWGPAISTKEYLDSEVGEDKVEAILEEQFPDGIDETDLNDLFAYQQIKDTYYPDFFEWFGVADPSEEDIEDIEDIEEVDESCDEELDDINEKHGSRCHKLVKEEKDIFESGDFDDYADDIAEVENDDDDIRAINKQIRRNRRLADKEMDKIRRRERNADNRLMRKHRDEVDYRRGDMKRHFDDDDISEDEI